MSGSDHYCTAVPECPHCGHIFSVDDMLAHQGEDLFALATDEGRCEVACPQCARDFWLRGDYLPRYTSAMTEDDL